MLGMWFEIGISNQSEEGKYLGSNPLNYYIMWSITISQLIKYTH